MNSCKALTQLLSHFLWLREQVSAKAHKVNIASFCVNITLGRVMFSCRPCTRHMLHRTTVSMSESISFARDAQTNVWQALLLSCNRAVQVMLSISWAIVSTSIAALKSAWQPWSETSAQLCMLLQSVQEQFAATLPSLGGDAPVSAQQTAVAAKAVSLGFDIRETVHNLHYDLHRAQLEDEVGCCHPSKLAYAQLLLGPFRFCNSYDIQSLVHTCHALDRARIESTLHPRVPCTRQQSMLYDATALLIAHALHAPGLSDLAQVWGSCPAKPLIHLLVPEC